MALPLKVIDLFAGPGGLGEGFAALSGTDGDPLFKICLSIEKDPSAQKTLKLRAFSSPVSYGRGPEGLLPVSGWKAGEGSTGRALR